jgi:hypothetical protein
MSRNFFHDIFSKPVFQLGISGTALKDSLRRSPGQVGSRAGMFHVCAIDINDPALSMFGCDMRVSV